MARRSGEPFERLVRVLFGGIMIADLGRPVEIMRNIVLQGKTTDHEIDVFWRHQVGNIFHEVVIQAKDWTRPVIQGEVLKFKAVLDDLPNQPRGIMVARAGFQKGARTTAEANGIMLFTVSEYPNRTPTLEVTTTSVTQLSIVPRPGTVVVDGPETSVATQYDHFMQHDVWFAEEMRLHFYTTAPILNSEENPASLRLFGPDRAKSQRIADLIQECLRETLNFDLESWAGTRLFREPVALEARTGKVLAERIRAIEVSFRIRHLRGSQLIGIPGIVDYIVRNVVSGEESMVRLSQTS